MNYFSDIEIVEKKLDTSERSITHYISKKSLDRGGDIVLPDSIDTKNYRKNPVVLFNHDMDRPIGKSLWTKPDEDGVLSKTQFGTTPLADDIYQLNKEGVLNGWSIGFIPRKWEFDEEKKVTTFTNIELLEYSSVTIPMNQDAVTEGLKMVKSQLVKDVLTNQKRELEFIKRLNEHDELFKRLLEKEEDNYLEDLEKLEKEFLAFKEEFNKLKLSVGTLGKFDARELANSISKRLSGDVS